jgi:hypothetical protein
MVCAYSLKSFSLSAALPSHSSAAPVFGRGVADGMSVAVGRVVGKETGVMVGETVGVGAAIVTVDGGVAATLASVRVGAGKVVATGAEVHATSSITIKVARILDLMFSSLLPSLGHRHPADGNVAIFSAPQSEIRSHVNNIVKPGQNLRVGVFRLSHRIWLHARCS